MIELKDISFSYGDENTLKDISLKAENGDVVAILGNNGEGKSTLISCINGIRKPKSGEVLIDGKAADKMRRRELAKLIAYVPQKSDDCDITVFDSILLGRKPYIRWNITEDDTAICQAVINRLGLEKLALRSISELSGGEAQKAMLARALVQEPKVMLLDEPTSSLDPRSQHEVMSLVRGIAKEKGIAVLVVLHDINLALHFADKLFLMKDGRGRIFTVNGIDAETIKAVYGIDVDIAKIGERRFVMIKD